MADPWAEFFPKQSAPAAADPWAEFFPKKPTTGGEIAADIAKSAGIGTVEGLIGVPGGFGDARELGSKAVQWAAGKFGASPETQATLGKVVDYASRVNPLLSGPTSKEIQKTIEGAIGTEFYKPQTTPGEYARTGAAFIPSALLGPGGKVRNAVQGAASGLGSEAAGQYTKGSAYEPVARIAGALAGGLVPSAAAKVVTPLPIPQERQAFINALEKEGIPLTAGQKTGYTPLKYAESVLGDVPFAGQQASNIQRDQLQALTGAAMKRVGSNERSIGPESMDRVYSDLGKKFDDLAATTTGKMDKQFADDLGSTVQNYIHLTNPGERKPLIDHVVGTMIDLSKNSSGQVAGEQYKAFRSQLTKAARQTQDAEFKTAVGGIVEALDGMMARSAGPAAAKAWQEVRGQYRNLMTLENAAGMAGENAAQGMLSPSGLRSATVNAGKRDYVRGNGDFAELARAAEAIMKPLPNSGTAPRNNIQNIMTGGGFMVGGLPGAAAGLAGPAVLGRALMSKPGQAYLGNQVMAKLQNNNPSLASPKHEALLRALMATPAIPKF